MYLEKISTRSTPITNIVRLLDNGNGRWGCVLPFVRDLMPLS